MPTTRGRARAPAQPVVAVPKDRFEKIEESLGKVREANHTKANREAVEAGIEHAVERAVQKMGLTPNAGGRLADVPLWIKIAASVMGIAATAGALIGIIWSIAIAPVNVRLQALETAKSEATASLAATLARQQAADAKVVELSTTLTTSSRIRDQQQQALTDRLRGLELSDQSSSQQVNALAQSLAGLVARMEEMLRRQERLENRLSSPGTRQGSDDVPARATAGDAAAHI